jgi:hypothetical protein
MQNPQPFPTTPPHLSTMPVALQEQISGDVSADMMVISDPSLRAVLTQYVQEGQTVQRAPEESS